jgi:hypothetical protein
VGIQETKKATISSDTLESVNRNMVWNFIPVKGSAGGILLGFRNSTIEILECHGFEFSAVAVVKNKHDNLVWRLIVVYGSPYEEFKVAFLEELEVVMTRWQGPTLVGGRGVNLVRNQREKNNGVVNFNHVSLFNEWINK